MEFILGIGMHEIIDTADWQDKESAIFVQNLTKHLTTPHPCKFTSLKTFEKTNKYIFGQLIIILPSE